MVVYLFKVVVIVGGGEFAIEQYRGGLVAVVVVMLRLYGHVICIFSGLRFNASPHDFLLDIKIWNLGILPDHLSICW